MVYYHEYFDTKEQAEKWRKDLYESYHPCGYGTMISIYPPNDAKNFNCPRWLATGSRGSSCD